MWPCESHGQIKWWCYLPLFTFCQLVSILWASCRHKSMEEHYIVTVILKNTALLPLVFPFFFSFLLNFRCITASADQQVFAKRFFFLSRPRRTLPPERALHCKGRVTLPKRMIFRKGSKRPLTPTPRRSEWSLSLEFWKSGKLQHKMKGGSKAVWISSKNSSDLVALSVPLNIMWGGGWFF